MISELLEPITTVLVFFVIGWPITGLIVKMKRGGYCGGGDFGAGNCYKSGANDCGFYLAPQVDSANQEILAGAKEVVDKIYSVWVEAVKKNPEEKKSGKEYRRESSGISRESARR